MYDSPAIRHASTAHYLRCAPSRQTPGHPCCLVDWKLRPHAGERGQDVSAQAMHICARQAMLHPQVGPCLGLTPPGSGPRSNPLLTLIHIAIPSTPSRSRDRMLAWPTQSSRSPPRCHSQRACCCSATGSNNSKDCAHVNENNLHPNAHTIPRTFRNQQPVSTVADAKILARQCGFQRSDLTMHACTAF